MMLNVLCVDILLPKVMVVRESRTGRPHIFNNITKHVPWIEVDCWMVCESSQDSGGIAEYHSESYWPFGTELTSPNIRTSMSPGPILICAGNSLGRCSISLLVFEYLRCKLYHSVRAESRISSYGSILATPQVCVETILKLLVVGFETTLKQLLKCSRNVMLVFW